jgi:hypothetical protein
MKKTILITFLIATFAAFTSPIDAATRTHEINFEIMVPCVGETVHLHGPFHITLTFSGKNLTNVEVSIQGIRGTGENPRHTYVADQNNKNVSTPSYTVRNGVGRGNIIVTFQIIGRVEGNPGISSRFWAKQIVRVDFGKNLNLDFESLKVCVLPTP